MYILFKLYKQVEQPWLITGGRRCLIRSSVAAAAAVLQRREVEVRHGLLLLRLDHGRRRLAPVPAHVPAERLAHGELEPADGALVRPRPAVPLAGRRRRVAEQPRVAGAVAAERLERREPLPARLALEHALRRHLLPPPAAAARRRRGGRRQREQRVGVHPEALHLLALLGFLPRERHQMITIGLSSLALLLILSQRRRIRNEKNSALSVGI
jgi:hypothetical protein